MMSIQLLFLSSSYQRHDIISSYIFYNIYNETINLVMLFSVFESDNKELTSRETFECLS